MNSKMTITEMLEEINKSMLDWNLDRTTLMEIAAPQEPFVEVDKVQENPVIRPFHSIVQLLEQQGSLWTIIDLINPYAETYPYYIVVQKIEEKDNDKQNKWQSFLKYPSENSIHFNKNLLDLSKTVLGKSTNPIYPILIHKQEVKEELPDIVKTFSIKDYLSLIQGYISEIQQNIDKNNNTVSDLIDRFQERFPKEKCEEIWEAVDKKWDVRKREKENKWENAAQKFVNYLFWLIAQNDDWNYYYYIPGVVHKGNLYQTIGGIAIAMPEELPSDVYIFIFEVSSRLLEKWTLSYSELFREIASLRSAVAAIMARNMSHNIGSHVLANVSTTSDILNQKDIKNLEKFIQQRMDFIAQISTEFPQWSYPCWFYKQLMYNFYSQRYLLEYISSSEGLKPYDYNINNQTKKLKINYKLNGENTKDVLVSIPGGMIGHHAFYIILEDIIRNSAKHNWAVLEDDKKKNENLEITIQIEDKPENDYVVVTIWDNISDIQVGINEDLPNNFQNIKPQEFQNLPLHQKMNTYLTRGIIDETGKLRKENWGLAEMKISAGYLQKKSTEEIGGEGKEVLDIIKAVAIKDNNNSNKYHLGYTFKMLKPKEVLIITNDNVDDDKKNELKKFSIYVEKQIPQMRDYEFCVIADEGNDLVKRIIEISNGRNNDILRQVTDEIEKYPYRLFICLSNSSNQIKLPSPLKERIVFISKKELESIFQNNKNNIEKFKTYLYYEWIKHLAGLRGQQTGVTLLVKLTGKDTSSETLPSGIEKLNDDVKELLGLTPNYVPYTLPKDLRLDSQVSTSNEPYTNNIFTDPNNFVTIENPPESSVKIRPGDNNNNNKIIYARHKSLDRFPPTCLYFESLTGAAQHLLVISQLPQDEYYKNKLIYQLVENGLINIGICDERFAQSTIFSTQIEGVAYNRYLIASGIYIIGKFFNYQIDNIQQDYVVFIENDNNEIKIGLASRQQNGEYKIINQQQNEININLQFLIIHQGILDKLGKDKKGIEDLLNQIKSKIPFVVVTSGRGRPENVPDNVKFLPFANLEATLLCKPHSKFLLTQLLMNI